MKSCTQRNSRDCQLVGKLLLRGHNVARLIGQGRPLPQTLRQANRQRESSLVIKELQCLVQAPGKVPYDVLAQHRRRASC